MLPWKDFWAYLYIGDGRCTGLTPKRKKRWSCTWKPHHQSLFNRLRSQCLCSLDSFLVVQGGCGSGVRASLLLSEDFCFDSPGLHVEVSLGKILNSKLLLMCWSSSCMAATTIGVCMYELLQVALDKKCLINALNLRKIMLLKQNHLCFFFFYKVSDFDIPDPQIRRFCFSKQYTEFSKQDCTLILSRMQTFIKK